MQGLKERFFRRHLKAHYGNNKDEINIWNRFATAYVNDQVAWKLH